MGKGEEASSFIFLLPCRSRGREETETEGQEAIVSLLVSGQIAVHESHRNGSLAQLSPETSAWTLKLSQAPE